MRTRHSMKTMPTYGLTKDEKEEIIKIEEEVNGKCDKFEVPSFLEGNEFAINEFLRIADELQEIGVLSNIDNIQLGMYCQLYSTYIDCVKMENEKGFLIEYTNKSGETNLVEAPWSKLKRQTETQMIALGKNFGLSPIDRLKFVPIKQEKNKKDDPLLSILD